MADIDTAAPGDVSVKKILVYTAPYADGLGDLYSAQRMALLIKEQHPEWNVQLYIERLKPNTPADIACNAVAEEISTISSKDVLTCQASHIVCVAGTSSEGVKASYHERNTVLYLQPKPVQLEVHEYGSTKCKMMRMASSETKVLMSKVELAKKILPLSVQTKLSKGDYFFSYGRGVVDKAYIEDIIDGARAADKPIYTIAPGIRDLKLDPKYKVCIVDYNTGGITGDLEGADVVLVRGRLSKREFTSLLANTEKLEVLGTGDMSLTEMLHLGKIPLYDYRYESEILDQLYGEDKSTFVYKTPYEEAKAKAFITKARAFLAIPANCIRLQAALSANFKRICTASYAVCKSIETDTPYVDEHKESKIRFAPP